MTDFSRLKELFSSMEDGSSNSRHRDSTVVIIDGMNTFVRVFSAVPALNDNGEHIGGVAGFLKSVSSNIRQFGATRCIIVFDGQGGSLRRRKMYSDYKTGRRNNMTFNRFEEFASVEDERASMKRQFARIGEYLQYLPVTTIMIDHIEADDTIAYMVQSYFSKKNSNVVVVSSDKDYLQLVRGNVSVWSPVKRKLYDEQAVLDEYGVSGNNFLLYRALTGDTSDNIPGIKGMGLKTLLKMFPQLGQQQTTVDELLDICRQQDKPAKLHTALLESQDTIHRNLQLMQLQDVDISSHAQQRIWELTDVGNAQFDRTYVKRLAIQDGLPTYIKDLDLWLRDSFNPLQQYANLR